VLYIEKALGDGGDNVYIYRRQRQGVPSGGLSVGPSVMVCLHDSHVPRPMTLCTASSTERCQCTALWVNAHRTLVADILVCTQPPSITAPLWCAQPDPRDPLKFSTGRAKKATKAGIEVPRSQCRLHDQRVN
jgi:hypothetical protein